MLLRRPWSRVIQRVRLAALAALVLVLPASAHGAVHADINGDGVLDTIRIEPHRSAHGTSLAFEISGRPTTWFAAIEETVLSIGVADIDRDGHQDIIAAAPHRGLFFWRNLGNGRFAAHLHLHPLHPTGPPLICPPNRSGAADDPQGARAVDELSSPDDAAIVVAAILPSPSTVSRLYTRDQRGSSRYVDRNRSSRAPPA